MIDSRLMTAYALAIAFAAVLATFAVVAIRRSREGRAWQRSLRRRYRLRGGWRR